MKIQTVALKRGHVLNAGVSALVASIALSTFVAKAADIEWQGGTASYTNAADWVGGVIPGSADWAVNDNGTNNVVQINAGDPDWTIIDLRAGNGGGDGAFEQNGATVNINGWFRLGVAAGNTGVYTLNDGTINYNGGDFNVGELGTALLNVNGGSITGSGNFADNLGSTVVTAVTASMDGGTKATGTTWYEQGLDTGDAAVGLPPAGSTFTSTAQADHSYTMAPSYAGNDAVMVDSNITSATMTLSTPTAFSALSFLGSAGNGPMTINYVVHHADSTTETGSLTVLDWFNKSGTVALGVGGRVNADATGVADFGAGNNPFLLSMDVTLNNASSPVTSIDLIYDSGVGVACLLAVSGSSGGDFTPIAFTGYNEDMIIEAGVVPQLSSAVDVVNQTAGAINVTGGGQLFVGNEGTGVYNLSGGSIDVHNYIAFGRSGGTGTFNMTGGALNQDGGGNLLVGTGFQAPTGGSAVGVLNQSGGTINSQGQFLVPESSPSTGTYNLGGTGVLNVHDWLAIGRNGGTGTLNISNNASITHDGNGNIAVGSGGPGTVNQYGGAITNLAGQTWIGQSSGAVWNLNGGIANLGVVHLAQEGEGSGQLNMNGGSLYVSELAIGSTAGGAAVNFNGGTVYATADNPTFMHGITFVGIDAGGLTIDSQGHDINISQELDDVGGGDLVKNGDGILVLSGPNTYSGDTIINGGALITDASSQASGNYIVADNAAFGVMVESSGSQLSANSLTVGDSVGATLDFDFGTGTTTALLNVGTLTANGTITVNITGAPQMGEFPLISYGTMSGSADFEIGSLPDGVEATIVNNTANNSIDLDVTSVNLPVWSGTAGGDWDIGLTQNWINQGTGDPTYYTEGNAALFNDSATGTTTVNLVADVHPASVVFTNDSLAYTVVGTGKISGAIGLAKQGSSSLSVLNAGGNDYTGPTVISGGTLSVTNLANGGSPSAIGASSADAANLVIGSGTFSYGGAPVSVDRGLTLSGSSATIDAEGNLALGGRVAATGSGGFVKTGPAQLGLTGANTNEFAGGSGPNPGAQVVNGTLLLDGSAGNQVNHTRNDFYVGNTTATGASLILSNTTLNVDGWIAVGRINGGINNTSTLTLYNSTLNVGHLSFGWDGGQAGNLSSQFLTMNGNSTLNDPNEVNLCEGVGSTLRVSLNDNSVLNFPGQQGNLALASNSTGIVVVANSARIVESKWFGIALGQNSFGSVLLKDNASISVGVDLNVTDTGAGATGIFTAQDNATVYANNIWVGKQNGVNATLTITNNATVVSTNAIRLATYFDGSARVPASAVVNLSGGSLTATVVQGSVTSGTNNGVLNFNGGKLIAGNGAAADYVVNLQAVNVLGGGATVDSGTNNISIAQALLAGDANGGGLTKLGSGALYLNGANTYTGATLVNEGTLGGAGTIAGPVTIASGATLAAGTSGTSIGTLTINSNLTLSAGSTTFIKLTPSSNDQITGLNDVSYGGALVVTNTSDTPLTPGSQFKLFNSATAGSGDFTSVTILPAGSGTFDPTTGELTITSSGSFVINPPVVSGSNLILTGTGGTPGASYSVLSTTNLADPLVDWTTDYTGTFDGAGAFSNNIPINLSDKARFFNVRTP